ncbi:MAG: hypothetical protein ACP5HU_10310 [Phycisphaerae bacterium]
MAEQITLRSSAPLFDVQYIAPSKDLFDACCEYPLVGVRGLRSCAFDPWKTEFDLTLRTFRTSQPKHCASVDRAVAANSLYSLSGTGICDLLAASPPHPIFTRNAGLLFNRRLCGSSSIALEGGICLFQPGELVMEMNGSKGEVIDLFYGASRTAGAAEAIRKAGVSRVTCRRRLPSLQDYLHLYRLLSFAAVLNAPAIVGLPDAEYISEANRIMGVETAERFRLKDSILGSSRQVARLANLIARRLDVKIILNSSESDVPVRMAMRRAREEVMCALASGGDEVTAKRTDLVGYLAMPRVPHHLLACDLTVGVLPSGEIRTIRRLSKLFHHVPHAFIVFPDLPMMATSETVDLDIMRSQLTKTILSTASHDLAIINCSAGLGDANETEEDP